MQCHQNLILPIVVPAVSYLVFKSFSSGVSSASLVTNREAVPFTPTVGASKMKGDLEEVEMKQWSSRNLRINDPNYNPFMKHELKKSLLCDCGNCIKARMKQPKSHPVKLFK